jgi:hypothetical protein
MAEQVLLVVAIRTDNEQVKRRMETILAAATTYEVPPDTEPASFAKPVTELTANDADHLAHFIGRDGFSRLNVGDVVGPDWRGEQKA